MKHKKNKEKKIILFGAGQNRSTETFFAKYLQIFILKFKFVKKNLSFLSILDHFQVLNH